MNWDAITKEIGWSAARSRGPGGQNVNKVSSAAQLTWNFETSMAVSLEEKSAIRRKLPTRISRENELYLRCDEYRDFPRNKERCLEKLRELLEMAFHKPKPRRATKPTRASRLKRAESKKRRGDVKRMRGKVRDY